MGKTLGACCVERVLRRHSEGASSFGWSFQGFLAIELNIDYLNTSSLDSSYATKFFMRQCGYREVSLLTACSFDHESRATERG